MVKIRTGERRRREETFQSLRAKGTGWCTAGHSTAQTQIESGDFYVYYTNDSNGEPAQPRLAIRMDGDNRIGEVRGILPHQGVEPVMQESFRRQTFGIRGEADAYRKKSEDMRMLTALEKNTRMTNRLPKTILFCCTKSTELSKASDIRKTLASPNFARSQRRGRYARHI